MSGWTACSGPTAGSDGDSDLSERILPGLDAGLPFTIPPDLTETPWLSI
ncbi:MAG: hypothetical protein ACLTBV_14910 [Enterocloster bolteae]